MLYIYKIKNEENKKENQNSKRIQIRPPAQSVYKDNVTRDDSNKAKQRGCVEIDFTVNLDI